MGAAVVVDLRDVTARHRAKGKSTQVSRAWLERWEARHGRFGAGEVPLLYSGYTDLYFKRFPDRDRTQDRLLWKPLEDKSEPGWVVLHPRRRSRTRHDLDGVDDWPRAPAAARRLLRGCVRAARVQDGTPLKL